MSKNLGILGGDLRIIFLSNLLAKEGYNIYTYGIESYNINIKKCKTIEEISKICNIVISGIPFSKDGILVNSPFSDDKIKVDTVLEVLKNKTLIAGAIKQEIKEKAHESKINVVDIMDDESFTILNVIPTVEGAIQIAMENTDFTIHNSKCLVLGFGRIGKLLSNQLSKMGAKVSCMARKDKDLTWIKAYQYKEIHIDNLDKNLNKYDIIFNTVPSLIIDEQKLNLLKDTNTLIIELASKPGGIDASKAKEYNIKVIEAQGLPGKVAPLTSAKYIKETLEGRNLI